MARPCSKDNSLRTAASSWPWRVARVMARCTRQTGSSGSTRPPTWPTAATTSRVRLLAGGEGQRAGRLCSRPHARLPCSRAAPTAVCMPKPEPHDGMFHRTEEGSSCDADFECCSGLVCAPRGEPLHSAEPLHGAPGRWHHRWGSTARALPSPPRCSLPHCVAALPRGWRRQGVHCQGTPVFAAAAKGHPCWPCAPTEPL